MPKRTRGLRDPYEKRVELLAGDRLDHVAEHARAGAIRPSLRRFEQQRQFGFRLPVFCTSVATVELEKVYPMPDVWVSRWRNRDRARFAGPCLDTASAWLNRLMTTGFLYSGQVFGHVRRRAAASPRRSASSTAAEVTGLVIDGHVEDGVARHRLRRRRAAQAERFVVEAARPG
jgi:hypothetical protein